MQEENHSNTGEIDLAKELAKRTEHKEPSPDPAPDFEQENTQENQPPPNPDFEPEPNPIAGPVESEPRKEKTRTPVTPARAAKNVVKTLNGINKMFLPPLYLKAEFSATEKEKLQIIKGKMNNQETVLEQDEQNLVARLTDYYEFKEEVPFDDDEKEQLEESFTDLFEYINFTMHPVWGVLVVVTIIMLARVSPLLLKVVEKRMGVKK